MGTLKTWITRPVSRTGVLLTKWAMAVPTPPAGAALVALVALAAGRWPLACTRSSRCRAPRSARVTPWR